jgi:ribose-phosphate pyrophosphokinase
MKAPRPILFGIPEYEYLRKRLLKFGGFEEGGIEREEFPDGERYQRILNDVTGRDVIVLGSTISDTATLEMYDLSCALVKYGACSLTLVIPYFGYSTMERAVKRGEVVTAKTRARLFSAIPAASHGNRVFLVDLHAEGLPHYFEGEIRPTHLYAKEIIKQLARKFGGKRFVLACTDAGRAKWVESLAGELKVQTAFVYKRRLSGDHTEITGVSATVRDQRVVIYDDMIRTGSSLLQAAKAYRAAGASKVFAIATHGIFPGDSWARIRDSKLLDGVACTDTHCHALKLPKDELFVHSVDQLLADNLRKSL